MRAARPSCRGARDRSVRALAPGQSARGCVFFQVPAGAAPAQLELLVRPTLRWRLSSAPLPSVGNTGTGTSTPAKGSGSGNRDGDGNRHWNRHRKPAGREPALAPGQVRGPVSRRSRRRNTRSTIPCITRHAPVPPAIPRRRRKSHNDGGHLDARRSVAAGRCPG